MRLTLEAAKQEWRRGEAVTVRLVVSNDSTEPIAIDRRLLVGPNFSPEDATGIPYPIAVEPAFAEEQANHVILNPGGLYGRERGQENLPSGRLVVYGYLLGRATDALRPQGPAEEGAIRDSAEPLVLTIEE
jgi:hypothetical protein